MHGSICAQVIVLIAKHEALLDEAALRGMRAVYDEKQAEQLAMKGASVPDDLVRVNLVAKKEAAPPVLTQAQTLANQRAKVHIQAKHCSTDYSVWMTLCRQGFV